ncbi:zinc-binding dehydrogenase [Catenulispora subtropica]|uniref:zinc-binding dehydrogenase n=1 Tax=Catenulispora subtropica TaxID=450798 RepID=UPI003CD07D37
MRQLVESAWPTSSTTSSRTSRAPTRPARYNVILDIAGNRPLSHLRKALTHHGTLVIRAVSTSPFVSQKLRNLLALTRAADLAALTELIEPGELRPMIDRAHPLPTGTSIRRLREGHPCGGIVVTAP